MQTITPHSLIGCASEYVFGWGSHHVKMSHYIWDCLQRYEILSLLSFSTGKNWWNFTPRLS